MGGSYVEEGGEQKLQDKVSMEHLEKIFSRPDVVSAALHKPGSEITQPDGKRYIVRTDGSWAEVVAVSSEHP